MIQTVILWGLATIVHLALLWRIWHEYRWDYGTRAWRQGWGCFGLALVVLLIRRWVIFLYPALRQAPWFLVVDDFTPLLNSTLLFLFVWRLSTVFHIELPMTTEAVATIVIDRHSLILEWAPQTELLFGWTAEDVVGQKTLMQTIILPQDWEAHRNGVARWVARAEQSSVLARTYQMDARHKDGTCFRVEIGISAFLTDENEWRFRGIVRRLRTL